MTLIHGPTTLAPPALGSIRHAQIPPTLAAVSETRLSPRGSLVRSIPPTLLGSAYPINARGMAVADALGTTVVAVFGFVLLVLAFFVAAFVPDAHSITVTAKIAPQVRYLAGRERFFRE